MKMLYFAYGSNLNHEQMRTRCPSVRFLKRGVLIGYSLVFDGYSESRRGAVANIIESPGGVVWGGLYTIDQESLDSLDRYEGYHEGVYDRKIVHVKDDADDSFIAWVYLREPLNISKPSADYLNVIFIGVKDSDLPDSYIEIIDSAANTTGR